MFLDQMDEDSLVNQNLKHERIIIKRKNALKYLDEHPEGIFFVIDDLENISDDSVHPLAVAYKRVSFRVRPQDPTELVEVVIVF